MGKEKKEIGKLLELLNEYHHFNSDLIGYFYDDEYDKFYFRTELPEEKKEELKNADALIDDGISEVRVEDERIISKKFGFIKWLVENDKIDKKKIDTRLVRNVESHYDEDGYWVENSYEDYSNTDTLLMLLSISSSPIEDLLLYLK